MELHAARAGRAEHAAVHRHEELTRGDATKLGDEAADLAVLIEAGVPVCPGWVVSFDVHPEELASSLTAAFVEPASPRPPRGSQPPPARPCLRLRPWFRTPALAARAERSWPLQADIFDAADVRPRLEALWSAIRESDPDLASVRDALRVRALRCDEGVTGSASSVSMHDGDPSTVSVWSPEANAFTLDRRTMRVVGPSPFDSRAPIPQRVLESAADLVDRAQLALGRPCIVDWVLSSGRAVVASVRPFVPPWRFTDATLRLVQLLWQDEGPIAPLAVDCLDKALRGEKAADEPCVRRVFARAYRRVEGGSHADEGTRSWREAFGRMASIVTDVARPIAAARAFARALDDRLLAFDADDVRTLDDAELLRALRERQRVVIEAAELLDRARKATAVVIGGLEASLGTLPHDCIASLAAIRRTRARRRLDERLAREAQALGDLPQALDPVPAPLRRHFADLRREFSGLRPLGLDVRPPSYGASDAALAAGMRAALEGRAEQAEQDQRDAIRRLVATAQARPLGKSRAAFARALALVIEQLADAKGTVADGLAASNLRLREVAMEIGRRLVERGVLDEPGEALDLYVTEIQDALRGEPGAYTARVRLRREEDARWRAFNPPTRLAARPPAHSSWSP